MNEPLSYASRLNDGFYDTLYKKFQAFKDNEQFMFGNMFYGFDGDEKATFTPSYEAGNPSASKSFGRTTYIDKRTKEELNLIVFGEVDEPSNGTCISARGNHLAPKQLPITDKSNVRDVIAIRALTNCGENSELKQAFENQIETLSDIVNLDAELATGIDAGSDVTSFILTENPVIGASNRIKITLPLKYQANAGSTLPIPTVVPKKRKVLRGPDNNPNEFVSQEHSTLNIASSSKSECEIKDIGSTYPCSYLDNHGDHKYFAQLNSRVVQQNIVDTNGTLVPPWQMWDKLRAGTLILVEGNLICWNIPPRSGVASKKIYQVVAHRIKVICPSPEHASPPMTIEAYEKPRQEKQIQSSVSFNNFNPTSLFNPISTNSSMSFNGNENGPNHMEVYYDSSDTTGTNKLKDKEGCQQGRNSAPKKPMKRKTPSRLFFVFVKVYASN
ncbi:hypothetical protein Agabi119p4_6992 [Agaricus bisporus var. burnettii]|uniref:Uncharacterized protein n=1 Tax=Agaricus bisporus var. burnettii TaxID=192524 RepID=A0A8H7KDU5_AGABI|nr:hypothetical protein Agabi119p4_6992 [Agaricus bisporus var. burnettii]